MIFSGEKLPAIVTGASIGIGADIARVMAREGHALALVARNTAQLEALAKELGSPGGRTPVVVTLDLSLPDAAKTLAAALDAAGFEPGILVNNAGYGMIGEALHLDPRRQLGMIDVNIHALTALTFEFLPAIVAKRGRIMNVGSTASFLPGGPGMTVYYATKAYVLSFSSALGQELAGKGVTVTALCPGPVATEFFFRAGAPNSPLKQFAMMPSRDVAETGYRALMSGRRIVVPGFLNKFMANLVRFVPRSLVLRVVARLQTGR